MSIFKTFDIAKQRSAVEESIKQRDVLTKHFDFAVKRWKACPDWFKENFPRDLWITAFCDSYECFADHDLYYQPLSYIIVKYVHPNIDIVNHNALVLNIRQFNAEALYKTWLTNRMGSTYFIYCCAHAFQNANGKSFIETIHDFNILKSKTTSIWEEWDVRPEEGDVIPDILNRVSLTPTSFKDAKISDGVNDLRIETDEGNKYNRVSSDYWHIIVPCAWHGTADYSIYSTYINKNSMLGSVTYPRISKTNTYICARYESNNDIRVAHISSVHPNVLTKIYRKSHGEYGPSISKFFDALGSYNDCSTSFSPATDHLFTSLHLIKRYFKYDNNRMVESLVPNLMVTHCNCSRFSPRYYAFTISNEGKYTIPKLCPGVSNMTHLLMGRKDYKILPNYRGYIHRVQRNHVRRCYPLSFDWDKLIYKPLNKDFINWSIVNRRAIGIQEDYHEDPLIDPTELVRLRKATFIKHKSITNDG